MKNKKRNRIFLLLILLLGIGVGFAALATTLKINGSAAITKNTWNVYWDNIHNESGVTPTTETTIVDESTSVKKNIVNFSINFEAPGDYYEFTVDAVNAGTLDAMIIGIESKINDDAIITTQNGSLVVTNPSPVPNYIKYEISYADGSAIELNHLLAKADVSTSPATATKETYKIRIEYDANEVNPDDLDDDMDFNFSFALTYGQADENAVERTAVGEELCLGDGVDCFYILNRNPVKTVLLSKYNINNSTNRQDSTGDYPVAFSTPDQPPYWSSNGSVKPEYAKDGASFNGNPYPYVYDENSNTYQYVEAYVSYLKTTYSLSSVEGRLIKEEEVIKSKEEVEQVTTIGATNDNNNLVLYICFGAYAVLTLVIIIILTIALTKKNKKEVM